MLKVNPVSYDTFAVAIPPAFTSQSNGIVNFTDALNPVIPKGNVISPSVAQSYTVSFSSLS